MENSKNEIKKILDTYELYEDFSITNDEDIKHVIQHRKNYIPSEKPDAFFKQNNVIYGIEHFQISLYKKLKSGDISKQAKGSQCNREKMREDKDFDLHPSIENLLTALSDNLHSHSGSFEAYRDRLTKDNNCKYRLIIFVEDSSESGYIVRKRETQAINPLLLKQIANIFLEYKDDIWGVIVTTGNEKQKRITGCTLAELESKLGNGELFDANEYAPFEVERRVHVAKEDPTQDSNNITVERQVTALLDGLLQTPSLIEQPLRCQRRCSFSAQTELDEILEQQPIDEEHAKSLILKIAAEQYEALGDEEYETIRLRRLFKMTLTTKEAAEYSNIGINKIDSMLRSPNCPFVLFVGKKKLVKRKEFEEYISEKLVI